MSFCRSETTIFITSIKLTFDLQALELTNALTATVLSKK
jgi:hypothetical protein